MLQRYSYPEMRGLWSIENKFSKWLEVEILVCEGLAEIGQVPEEAAQEIRRSARFDLERIRELEGEEPVARGGIRHDLMAFLHSVMESLPSALAPYLHLGITSYDVEDTALCLLLRESADLLVSDLDSLSQAVRERAREHRFTPMMGRTHGVHAEPITFGFKLAGWLAELERDRERLLQAREMVNYGKISGAVGTYANIDPRVEGYVCQRLGLRPAAVSTQVLSRDRHAQYLGALAILGGSLERFATEIRNLQRTDILEVEEPFLRGQAGSSAMPHKRNPIVCERVCGLARLLRSYLVPALEDMALWHERDLCHSSVERVILPDANILADYMLRKFTQVMEGLVVYPERMRANLERLGGLVFSEQVMLALMRKGMGRQQAYSTVQGHAQRAFEEGRDFKDLLSQDPAIFSLLGPEELQECFDLKRHLRHLDLVFQRLGI